jgi:uncharacterized OB-fold protein
MGLDVSVHMTIGIRVRREDLFEKTGTEYRCDRGHLHVTFAPFCPQCGSKVAEQKKEAARPAFAAYAASVGKAPEAIWDGEGAIAVHGVDGLQGSEDRMTVHVVGERIAGTNSHRSVARGSPPCGTSLAALAEREDRIHNVAKGIGVPEPHTIEVFACAYLSY